MTDEQKSAVRQEVKHHMGRRCFGWDYRSRCIYMITITLANRSKPILGQLICEGDRWAVEASEIGRIVEECWREIPEQWPGVEILESQLMPDHFHGIIFVKEPQQKTLGNIIGSFKAKSSSRVGKLCRKRQSAEPRTRQSAEPTRESAELARQSAEPARESAEPAHGEVQNGAGIWAPGFVDLILFREGQLKAMIAYVRDNPRRLGVKRGSPALFKVARDLVVNFAARGEAQNPASGKAQNPQGEAQNPASGEAQKPHGGAHSVGQNEGCAPARVRAGGIGHFMAIGNHFLLEWPDIRQVQCSRSFFGYKRERPRPQAGERRTPQAGERRTGERGAGGWKICRDGTGRPIVDFSTPEFEAKAEAALASAARGAVLISPCISHGEREIARRAFEAGYRVITLQNKGFSPLYKPGGKLFETCANGNLLMLAPINWLYVPGEKPMTREQAQVLNRIAQLIAGDGAVDIDYKGAVMRGIDEAVTKAISKGN